MKSAILTHRDFKWPLDALPALRNSGRFTLDDRAFAVRYLTGTHALHVHSYHGQMLLGEAVLSLRPGDVTITPANLPSWYDLPSPGFHWCVHFLPAVVRRVEPDAYAASAPARRASGGARCDDAAPAAHEASNGATLPLHLPLGSLGDHVGQKIMAIAQLRTGGADAVSSAAASAAMLELLLWLSMQARVARKIGGTSRGIAAVEQAATIIQQRMAGDLCIADLAEEVNVTQNYLARIFRLRYGTTMPHFLLTSRMDSARHLLRHTEIPIARIAARVGMPDPQHFNKQFRRLVGVSPSEYRAAASR